MQQMMYAQQMGAYGLQGAYAQQMGLGQAMQPQLMAHGGSRIMSRMPVRLSHGA